MFFPKLLRNRYVVILTAVLILGGGVFLFFGFAPVMSVDGNKVGIGEFSKIKNAISQFDLVSHADATSTLPVELNKRVLGNIIDRLLLDKLVLQVDSSINQKAVDLVKQTIASNSSFSLADAAQKLYGLSEKDFTDIILVPQAKRNLLADQFRDDPNQLNAAWDKIVKNANVKIYYPGYYWENGEVKAK